MAMKRLGLRAKIRHKIEGHGDCAICLREEDWDKSSRARENRSTQREIREQIADITAG